MYKKSNTRQDKYGGTFENRLRFPLEVLDEVIKIWGADKVGYHISPKADILMPAIDLEICKLTIEKLIEGINKRNIAFIFAREKLDYKSLFPNLRKLFNGKWIANKNIDIEKGKKLLAMDEPDAIGFGKISIPNPDLVKKITNHEPMAQYDEKNFYGS